MLTRTQFSTPKTFKKELSLSTVSTLNFKDVISEKTPKNSGECIINTGLCLSNHYKLTFVVLYIIYALVLENRSTELGIWLNDLNNNSILSETISDVSIDS